MSSPFKDYKYKMVEVEIDGEKIKVKPQVKHAEMFLSMKQGDLADKDAKRITEMLIELIQGANPEDDVEDIRSYVAEHYGTLFKELMVIYKFVTREKLTELEEASKKKLETNPSEEVKTS